MTRIAINGFGRMGRLVLRALIERDDLAGLEVAAINDPAFDAESAAHLLEFDSVHGRLRGHEISASGGALAVDGVSIPLTAQPSPAETGWGGDEIDLVIECSGKFKSPAALSPYLEAGISRVLVSAPVKDPSVLNIVMGINQHLFEPDAHPIVTAASCTTNCLAPMVKVMHESFGIRHGSITTIHDVTNTQVMVDAPHKDLRRGRSGLTSLIPTTTGSATAIGLIYPELQGRLDGHAVRVPLLNASLTDAVFELERAATAEEINTAFKEAAEGPLKGVLGVEERPLVSTDFRGDARSAIIDAPSTLVVNETQAKIYAWYDNEWGYVQRLAECALFVSRAG